MFKRFKKEESKNIQNPPDEVEDLEVLNEFEQKISFTERLRKWRKGLKNTIAFRFALTLLFILFHMESYPCAVNRRVLWKLPLIWAS